MTTMPSSLAHFPGTFERESELVNQVLASRQYFNGDLTRTLENGIAAVHKKRVATFVNSGTTAIDLAVHALKRLQGWQDGDEVLVPAVTFVGTVTPIVRAGLRPVFVDIDTEHFDIDVDEIDRHLTSRTRAIVPVHLYGQIARMERVMEIANAHGLSVIEDACEAMFVSRNGKMAGTWGDVVCFSTFQSHLLATGVGGFVATDDEQIAVKMKQLANHGMKSYELTFDDDGGARWKSAYYDVPQGSFGELYDDIGYSFRATEFEAAVGVAQLERWEEIVAIHQRNAERLKQNLADLGDRLQMPYAREGNVHGYFRVACLLLDNKIDRNDLARTMLSAGISCRWIFQVIDQPIYEKLFGDLESQYPCARLVNQRGIQLLCHSGLTIEDMDYCSDVMQSYFSSH
jgi:dTDP-4-amino-4,6-dideoxygalactose transaminase